MTIQLFQLESSGGHFCLCFHFSQWIQVRGKDMCYCTGRQAGQVEVQCECGCVRAVENNLPHVNYLITVLF